MEEVETRQLFLIILNTYSSFAYDDDKVQIWTDILRDVPFGTAQNNLRKYIRDPGSNFPPHPGALAETVVQRSEGPYVPNAEETLRMLDERDELHRANPAQLTDTARERMKMLGRPQSPATGDVELLPDS